MLLLLVLFMPQFQGKSGLHSLLGQCRCNAQSSRNGLVMLRVPRMQDGLRWVLSWRAHCSVDEECLQSRCHRLGGPGLAVLLRQATGHEEDLSNVFLQQVAAQPVTLRSSQGVTRKA